MTTCSGDNCDRWPCICEPRSTSNGVMVVPAEDAAVLSLPLPLPASFVDPEAGRTR